MICYDLKRICEDVPIGRICLWFDRNRKGNLLAGCLRQALYNGDAGYAAANGQRC